MISKSVQNKPNLFFYIVIDNWEVRTEFPYIELPNRHRLLQQNLVQKEISHLWNQFQNNTLTHPSYVFICTVIDGFIIPLHGPLASNKRYSKRYFSCIIFFLMIFVKKLVTTVTWMHAFNVTFHVLYYAIDKVFQWDRAHRHIFAFFHSLQWIPLTLDSHAFLPPFRRSGTCNHGHTNMPTNEDLALHW